MHLSFFVRTPFASLRAKLCRKALSDSPYHRWRPCQPNCLFFQCDHIKIIHFPSPMVGLGELSTLTRVPNTFLRAPREYRELSTISGLSARVSRVMRVLTRKPNTLARGSRVSRALTESSDGIKRSRESQQDLSIVSELSWVARALSYLARALDRFI